MALRILATGGTFDKHYDPIQGKLVFASSHLPQVLRQANVYASLYTIEELPLMDSLDMQDDDRIRVLQTCQRAPEKQIIIVHGTDTMRETATVLGLAALEKTIVLTGAMIPCKIADSDALFNLGFALGVVTQLPDGVYIAMNGRTFIWNDVQKNHETGRFETI